MAKEKIRIVTRHAVVPARAYADTRLTSTDRDVLAVISVTGGFFDAEAREGWFQIRQNDLAALAGRSKGTVNASIKKLKAANYLEKIDNKVGGQSPSFYRIKHDGFLPILFDLWARTDVKVIEQGAVQPADHAVQPADHAVQPADHGTLNNINENNAVQSADHGPLRLRTLDSLIKESKSLVAVEVREIDKHVDQEIINVVASFMGYRTYYFPQATSNLNINKQIDCVHDLIDRGFSAESLTSLIEKQVPRAAEFYAGKSAMVPNTINFFKSDLKKICPAAFVLISTNKGKNKIAVPDPEHLKADELTRWFKAIEAASAENEKVRMFQSDVALWGVVNNTAQLVAASSLAKRIFVEAPEFNEAFKTAFPGLEIKWGSSPDQKRVKAAQEAAAAVTTPPPTQKKEA